MTLPPRIAALRRRRSTVAATRCRRRSPALLREARWLAAPRRRRRSGSGAARPGHAQRRRPGLLAPRAAARPVHNQAGVVGAWISDVAALPVRLFGLVGWCWSARAPGSARLARVLRANAGAAATGATPAWHALARLRAAARRQRCARGDCASTAWKRCCRRPRRRRARLRARHRVSQALLGFAGRACSGSPSLVAGISRLLRLLLAARRPSGSAAGSSAALAPRRAPERAEDVRLGEQAVREREEIVEVEQELQEHHCRSSSSRRWSTCRRASASSRERQEPLFGDLPDTQLPQVDLLDAAPQRHRAVTAETLEITSRLIEKKLLDFGVEVRVVAAYPGPVITRYEIEPAVGVKGAQVVNLARDLARALSVVSIRVVETIPGKTLHGRSRSPTPSARSCACPRSLGSQVYADIGLAADDRAGQGHRRQAGGGRPRPRCRTCWSPAPPARASRSAINAMILSLLYKAEAARGAPDPDRPEDARAVASTRASRTCSRRWSPTCSRPPTRSTGASAEMERRYKLMSKLGVRNLAGYNQKIARGGGEGRADPESVQPDAGLARAAGAAAATSSS